MLSFRRLGFSFSLVLSAGAAHAVGTSISLTAQALGDSHYYFNSSSALTASGAVVANGTNGTANSSATVSMGELHTQTEAFTSMGDGFSSHAATHVSASDEVFATGAFTGTQVVVRWIMPVTGTGSSSGDGVANGTFSFFTQSFNDNQYVNYILQTASGITTTDGYFSNDGNVDYVDVTYTVGQHYVMGLSFDGTTDVSGPNGPANATLDFGHTAYAYAEVMTPGVTLNSVSGHDYVQPAPEPTTLVATAIGALAVIRRRRRMRTSLDI